MAKSMHLLAQGLRGEALCRALRDEDDDTLAPAHDAKPLRPFLRVGQEFTTGAKTLRLQRHHAPVQAHPARHFLVVADPDNRSASPLI